MRSLLAELAAMLVCAWASSAAAIPETSPPEPDIARERAALYDALTQAQQTKPDLKAIETALKTAIADPLFAQLSDDERHAAYLMYGATLLQDEQTADAKAPLKQASEMDEANAVDWDLRLRDSYALKDYLDAAHAVAVIAERWPKKLSSFRDGALFLLANEVQKPDIDPRAATEFLDALAAAKWTPKDPFDHPETDLWLDLLKKRLASGNVAGAAKAAAGLRDPVVLIKLRADKRFDAVVQAAPDAFDVAKAEDDELRAQRAALEKTPQTLKKINEMSSTLYYLNRPREALTLVSEAIDRAVSRPGSFPDERDQLHWSYDRQASALFLVGRSQDGFAALTAGASLMEWRSVNVSQAINLAGEYDVYARPRDAIKAVDFVGSSNVSVYGRMALDDALACAYFQLADKDDLADVLKYMKSHADDGVHPFLDTMLCTADLDAAAAFVIAKLRDPETRMDMLYSLQDYLPQAFATAGEQSIHANWLAVRNRPDVAQAIAAVGRIESYPMLSPSF